MRPGPAAWSTWSRNSASRMSGPGAPAREYFAMEALAPREIAPRPVAYVRAGQLGPGQWPIVVYQRMAGEMWDRPRPLRRRDGRSGPAVAGHPRGAGSGRAAGAGHRGRGRPAASPPAECLAPLCGLGPRSGTALPPDGAGAGGGRLASRGCCRRKGGELPVREVYCRSDARFSNVIARPDGRLGMVDWEDCGVGDPAQFVADLRIGTKSGGLDQRRGLAVVLGPVSWHAWPARTTLARRVALYELLVASLWLGWMAERVLTDAAAGPGRGR